MDKKTDPKLLPKNKTTSKIEVLKSVKRVFKTLDKKKRPINQKALLK